MSRAKVHPPAVFMSLRTCTYIAEKLIIETEKKKSEYVPEERENIGIKRRDLREWITKRE